ncbi:two-component system, NarL family, sensor histidine kinase LiaS [Granulicatella balaenopterae]|uniref:Sensor histidine kinase n=1 Tax=Granulicatella balaenopterae TaxID=137733 RepID=A0A1H9LUV6_9LACT|nr:sensor histidine kinase [Granulicatella balaenopterae]SER14643.1 two-component system, NarL family, sensor histidine kinase LiaS [Granulicatella balaenopterae]
MKKNHLLTLWLVFLTYLTVFALFIILALNKLIDWTFFLNMAFMQKLPILLSLILVVGITSLVGVFAYYLVVRYYQKIIRQQLHWLVVGNYEHPILSKPLWLNYYLPINLQSHIEMIQELKEKLISLSQEVQELSAIPQYVGKETKEEILTAERHRLARELHDSVSQQLFAAMMMLSAINEQADQLPANLQKSLSLVEKIINESQSEMRALLLHLRPVNLEDKSLKEGIKALLTELTSKVNMTITWELDDVHLPYGIEDHLFRIVQELLSNTLRHSKANSLEVYLKESSEYIILKVVDDGIGFDTKLTSSSPGSYGLLNMKERVTSMGGTCKIISFPDKGTIIEIKIPITKK